LWKTLVAITTREGCEHEKKTCNGTGMLKKILLTREKNREGGILGEQNAITGKARGGGE